MAVLDFLRPKAKTDYVLKRLEDDKAFWKAEMERAVKGYMAASWNLAIYKQVEKK